MAGFQDAVPGFRPCPTCGRPDWVENVAVARERAVETKQVTSPGPAVSAGPGLPTVPGPVERRSVTRPTALGRRLSPAPRSTAGPLVAPGVVCGIFAAWSFFVYRWSSPDMPGEQSSFPVAVPIVFGALAVACVLLAVVVQLRRAPVRRGRAQAEEVSRRGWYCGRCGTVYFQPGRAPEGARDSTSYPIEEFRRFVFRAGGYEHLVNVRSVR